MSLRVITPGQFTTIQDLGRPGWRDRGITTAGAFDHVSYHLANALAGNPRPEAALELTWAGGNFEAEHDLTLALAGAPIAAHLESPTARRPLRVPQSFTLAAGNRLVLGAMPLGARAYLAAHAGFLTNPILDSRSTESPLPAGTSLPALESHAPSRWPDPTLLAPFDIFHPVLRVIEGPEAAILPPAVWIDLPFTVAPLSDRVGVRLESPVLAPRDLDPHRLSRPVLPGAVQWTGAGLIVLGVAAGTMGGYPHIATVISADIPRLAQLRPGSEVRFALVSYEEACQIDRAHRIHLARLTRIVLAASPIDLVQNPLMH